MFTAAAAAAAAEVGSRGKGQAGCTSIEARRELRWWRSVGVYLQAGTEAACVHRAAAAEACVRQREVGVKEQHRLRDAV
jgi:hypothetical protein